MVVMQLLFDSLSRCFGMPFDPNDPHNHHQHHSRHNRNHRQHHRASNTSNPLGAQPLGASKSRNQSREQHQQDQQQHEKDSRGHHSAQNPKHQESQWDVTQQGSTTCCYSATANPLEEEQVPPKGLKREMFSKAQMHAINGRQRNRSTSSSSSKDQKDVLRKARKESTKRKLDIFRTQESYKRSASSASFASRLLNSETSFQTGAILCFANPIFDSEDDDLRLCREDNDGEDTITSTLYFDAKYEHMVEHRPPMPLYPEHALRLGHHTDEIVKLFEAGCIKHEIKSILCHKRASPQAPQQQPPPPQLKPGPKSMADSFSDAEEVVQYDKSRHDMYVSNISPRNQERYKTNGFVTSSQTSPIPSPPSVTKSRQELDVISDWVFSKNQSGEGGQEAVPPAVEAETIPPSLKLMNNSSLSTQALTPSNSASETHLSPKKGVYIL